MSASHAGEAGSESLPLNRLIAGVVDDAVRAASANLEALESERLRLLLRSLNAAPEVRRDLMSDWDAAHPAFIEAREALLRQRAAPMGNAEKQSLVAFSRSSRKLPVNASADETLLRDLELEYQELNLQCLGEDPALRRDILSGWDKVKGAEMRALKAKIDAAKPLGQQVKSPLPRRLAFDPPPGASEDLKTTLALENQIGDLLDADPPPLELSAEASTEEMEAWRERMAPLLEPLMGKLSDLRQKLAQKSIDQLIKENSEKSSNP